MACQVFASRRTVVCCTLQPAGIERAGATDCNLSARLRNDQMESPFPEPMFVTRASCRSRFFKPLPLAAGVYPSSARGTPRDCRGASTYWLGPSRAPSRLNHPSILAIPQLSPYGSFCTLRPHPAASVTFQILAQTLKSPWCIRPCATAPLRLVRRRSARCGPYHRTMTR